MALIEVFKNIQTKCARRRTEKRSEREHTDAIYVYGFDHLADDDIVFIECLIRTPKMTNHKNG